MTTSDPRAGERIVAVAIGEHTLSADLADGRTITVPLAWYPRLLHATESERANWKISGGGYGIHWPALDEDLSSEGARASPGSFFSGSDLTGSATAATFSRSSRVPGGFSTRAATEPDAGHGAEASPERGTMRPAAI